MPTRVDTSVVYASDQATGSSMFFSHPAPNS
jgi:hypothetical protein